MEGGFLSRINSENFEGCVANYRTPGAYGLDRREQKKSGKSFGMTSVN